MKTKRENIVRREKVLTQNLYVVKLFLIISPNLKNPRRIFTGGDIIEEKLYYEIEHKYCG